jgi:hypothetical protein
MTLPLDHLGASEPATRAAAAVEIFSLGCDMARRATRRWFAEAEIARCFRALQPSGALDDGLPETTVGIAVRPERFPSLRLANGSPPLADVPPDIDAQEFELHFAPGVRLDVLTIRDPNGDGAIARFLKRQGEGIQQVELATRDVDNATALLLSRLGLKAVYPAARPGADGRQVNFLLVDCAPDDGATKKLLIELVESPEQR